MGYDITAKICVAQGLSEKDLVAIKAIVNDIEIYARWSNLESEAVGLSLKFPHLDFMVYYLGENFHDVKLHIFKDGQILDEIDLFENPLKPKTEREDCFCVCENGSDELVDSGTCQCLCMRCSDFYEQQTDYQIELIEKDIEAKNLIDLGLNN